MKALLIYWIIGSAMSGLALGVQMSKCPHDEIPMSDVIGMAAIWPAVFFAGFTAPGKSEPRACKIL